MQTIGYCVHELVKGGVVQHGTFLKELNNPPIILTQDPDADQYVIGEGQISFSVLKPDQTFDAGEFIPNNRPYYNLAEPWEEDQEDGFDIYIDALHNLPDNASLVKIKAKVVNNKGVD
jgi:hypothetical protein